MTKMIVTIFVMLITSVSYGVTEEISTTVAEPTKWQANLEMSVFSVFDEVAPMVGPSLSYQVIENGHFGGRLLLPPAQTAYHSGFGVQAFWQQTIRRSVVDYIAEPSVGYNQIQNHKFLTFGASGGIRYHIDTVMSVGASLGLEFTNTAFNEKGPYYTSLFLTPKLGVFGTVRF